jgi:hypothetical protein
MKINETDPIIKQLNPVTGARPQPSVDKAFGKILEERVGHSIKDLTGTRQTAFTNPLNGVQMKTSTGFKKHDALDRSEHLIGLLDQYRRKLADPAATLKQIDPVIRQIRREADHLTPVLDALPENDGLKGIVNEILVTASTEISKFYRGDYI